MAPPPNPTHCSIYQISRLKLAYANLNKVTRITVVCMQLIYKLQNRAEQWMNVVADGQLDDDALWLL